LVINKETQMSDNLNPRIIEGRTYGYGSAPVSNFQVVYRPPGPVRTDAEIQADFERVFGKRVWPEGAE
jgi:hypothetical protein